MAGNTYVISTVNDFRSIPRDRLFACLCEFIDAIDSVALVIKDANEMAAKDGVVFDPSMVNMPEFIWTDDVKPGITGMPITYVGKPDGD